MYTYVQLINITWPTLMAPKSAVQRVERWLIRGPCSNWCPEQVPCIIERLVVVLCFAVALSKMHTVTVTICLSKTHLIKYVHSNPQASRLWTTWVCDWFFWQNSFPSRSQDVWQSAHSQRQIILQWSLRSRGLYGQTAKWETTSKTNIADIWLVCCGLEVNSY